MESDTAAKKTIWQRTGFWLCLWSVFASTAFALWQVDENARWTRSNSGSLSPAGIVCGVVVYFVIAFCVSGFVVQAWKRLPVGWGARLGLGSVSLAAGVLLYSLLISLVGNDGLDFLSALRLIALLSAMIMTVLLFLFSLAGFFRWLFRWQIFKWALLVLAVMVLLPVSFRLEENWRGRRAWENCRRAWEAKGERLDFAAFVPPAVPDEQNFAMASVVSNLFAGRGAARYQWDNEYARPGPLTMDLARTGLSESTNAVIGVWQMGRRTDLKAWQEYYRARFVTNDLAAYTATGLSQPNNPQEQIEVITLTNEFPVATQPQSSAEDVLLALSRYDAALAELAEAAKRPLCRFPLDYAATNPANIFLPHLAVLKQCATVLQLRAIANLEAGRSEQALADVNLMLRLADALRGEPMTISFYARLHIIGQAIQPIWEGLAARSWSESELKMLNQKMQSLNLISEWQNILRADCASTIGYVEYERKNRKETAGLMIFAICPKLLETLDRVFPELPELPMPLDHMLSAMEQCLPAEKLENVLVRLPPDGWYDLNKVALANYYQKELFSIADAQKHLVSLQVSTDVMADVGRKRSSYDFGPGDVLVFYLTSGPVYMGQRIAAIQNAVDMANVGCALERYRLAHGTYPASLISLAPDLIPIIPPDVVNGAPLKYRCLDDGRFMLYSVGWNGVDDGGIPGTNQYGRFSQKDGDWVWQYLPD